ncbi:prephenate dehydrogenase/arogenate dehydrogenase family protein [Blattabacterium cuenoti]|uniref:prephenate dehydrogenase/arogenate dehydrogenase family protein n=1 Tax=Blattabacterium cuenoti TaxID=1653831 RepID=UPI00163B6C4C|nr:prephenate dehydrogenase/arogenate dehydrogenase family protein [Blattabacterium cuenoti]
MKIIGIIGLGLIGGSIGLILRKLNFKVVGTDSNHNNSLEALQLGIVDEIITFQDLIKKSSVIILSIPVNNIIKILPIILNNINKNQVLIDTGSTKYDICNSVYSHPNRSRFVATHPIAGIENSGPTSAKEELFYHKNCIICDYQLSDSDALFITKKIFSIIMKMNISYINAEDHDMYISYISHLPHVISFCLAKTILENFFSKEKILKKMIGSSFYSIVRLAKSNPETWISIFSSNRINLINTIDLYMKQLKFLKKSLNKNDILSIKKLLKESNKIKNLL